MIQEYKTKTNIGVGVGILLQVAGGMLGRDQLIGSILLLVGFLFFIWGCSNYAQGKGYSNWLGALGLLSILGLVVLVVLPDKHK